MSVVPDITQYYFDGKAFVVKKKKRISLLVAGLLSIALLFGTKTIEFEYHRPSVSQQEQTTDPNLRPAVEYIRGVNKNISEDDAIKIVDSSIKWGDKFGVDPTLLLAIAKVESTFDRFAISPVGAFGVLQVLPKWHLDKIRSAKKEVGTPELFDIDANIYVGAQIIKTCKTKYKGDINTALRCYNGSVGMKTTYDKDVIQAHREIKYRVAAL